MFPPFGPGYWSKSEEKVKSLLELGVHPAVDYPGFFSMNWQGVSLPPSGWDDEKIRKQLAWVTNN